MQPHSRHRAPVDVPEKVHVGPPLPSPGRHSPLGLSASKRRRLRAIALIAFAATVAGLPLLLLLRWTLDTTVSTQAPNVTPSKPTPAPPYVNILDPLDQRTVRPAPNFSDIFTQYEDGEYAPEEPERLPGLQLHRRTFTPAELLEHFGDTDFIYSFVNGSEVNHKYRKMFVLYCARPLLEAENATYRGDRVPPLETPRVTSNAGSPQPNLTVCLPPLLRHQLTLSSTLRRVTDAYQLRVIPDIGDRETDELRYSLRSLEQHVRWHRGRVVVVSPGHHPTWLDGARNFLAGACGDAHVQALRSSGTHLRVTTVHQDAVMPYGLRLTVDSHVIEQHLWRVRNTTAVHVYMNDDYFVNRDVAVTDLFNEYGGTIVRTEKGILKAGTYSSSTSLSWADGVRHTHLFNIMELDLQHEDYLPESLVRRWSVEREVRGVAGGDVSVPPISLNDVVDAAYEHVPASLPTNVLPRRHRRYATHAPFVYCTNMLRFLQTRYAAELAYNALHHRSRSAQDLYVPFLYNAFIMARPWQASPKFLPYLLELQRSRSVTHADGAAAAAVSASITLDNFDGCAPASLRGGYVASEAIFAKFVDNVSLNSNVIERLATVNPLFFNINSAFSSAAAADQLRTFLHDKFPIPVYLEATTGAAADGGAEYVDDGLEANADAATAAAEHDAALHATFDALMALPVVGVVSDAEGVCPLVRSLSLAFAGHHRGGVHVSVVRHGGATLREARAALGHRVVSAMPAPACAYGASVVTSAAAADEAVADVARRVLGGADAGGGGGGVVLPATCGAGGAGLRVRGFVVDARTAGAPVRSAAALREALAVPAQTLALEDFRAVAVGPSAGDVVLVVSREDAAAKAVHWVTGASESDLLVTYPLPVEAYEDMNVPLRWAVP